MMKKLVTITLAALLLLTLALPALAAADGVEKTKYLGMGVFEVEAHRLPVDALFTVTDATGASVPATVVRTEGDEWRVQIENAVEGAEYTLSISTPDAYGKQTAYVTVPMRATYGDIYTLVCDDCGQTHGYDACPYDRDDHDDRYERCDYCGKTGHDDDVCPDRATNTRDRDDDDRYERCDYCGKTGHDDDVCPERPARGRDRDDDDDRYDRDDDDDDRYDRDDDDDDDDD